MSLITHKNQKGFTLLEIMVTMAIVGILAAIAIPIYNNYITKTRIADALTHGRVYAGKVTIDKEDVVEAPSDLEYSRIKLAGSHKKPRVRIKLKKTIDSTVLMDPDERAGGKVIVLSEQSSDASIRWACTTNLPQALIPEGCTHEEGVKDRKLLEAWAEGKGDACWSNARANKTGNGWSIGSCTRCVPTEVERQARDGYRPGAADAYGLGCGGLYGGDEPLAEVESEAASGPRAWDSLSPEEQASETPRWDQKVSEESLDNEGDGNGWVAGPNRVANVKELGRQGNRYKNPQDRVRKMPDQDKNLGLKNRMLRYEGRSRCVGRGGAECDFHCR